MEQIIQPVSDYVTALVVERWHEALALLVMIGLWRWFMGYKYQQQIDALKSDRSAGGVIIHGDVKALNVVRSSNGQGYTADIDGKGQIVSPLPVRFAGKMEGKFGPVKLLTRRAHEDTKRAKQLIDANFRTPEEWEEIERKESVSRDSSKNRGGG